MLASEATGEAIELARDALDGKVASGAFDGSGGCEHFALAGGFESAVELLVDGHAADGVVFRFECRIERNEFYIERARAVLGHDRFLLRGLH